MLRTKTQGLQQFEESGFKLKVIEALREFSQPRAQEIEDIKDSRGQTV